MSNQYLVEPCLDFVDQVASLGGDSVKKCYQCATCSVACPIAPEDSPFPRKEMIATSWGLKDRVLGSADIWMCHECGDCSTLCPRGAQPGDVLSAIRSAAITEYATPKFFAKMVNDAKSLPVVLAIPAVWFALLAFITMAMGETMNGIFKGIGVDWYHGLDKVTHIAPGKFMSTWFVDATFVPLSIFASIVFAIGLMKFTKNIHANAVLENKTDKKTLEIGGLIQGIIKVIPSILKHDKFNECGENKSRGNAHLFVLYGFIACVIATTITFVALYFLHMPSPHSFVNPVKWFGNVGGIAIIIGAYLMIMARLKKDEASSFKDWILLTMVMGIALTGMLAQFIRMMNLEYVSYFVYYIHLITVFWLIAYLPFSKMAHIVYRIVALGYVEYANRK
jgi:quinone-modifying oxidoreductase subunit QmoC